VRTWGAEYVLAQEALGFKSSHGCVPRFCTKFGHEAPHLKTESGRQPRAAERKDMALAATALNTWRIKYYETRAIAERALYDFRTAKGARPGAPFGQFWLALLFGVLNYFMKKLLIRLTALESQPPSFLLEGDGAKIPELLRELFHITCDVLMCAREEGLPKSFMLGRHFARLEKLSQQLHGFASRFEDAQQKLRVA
jgi:hypothetical protein